MPPEANEKRRGSRAKSANAQNGVANWESGRRLHASATKNRLLFTAETRRTRRIAIDANR